MKKNMQPTKGDLEYLRKVLTCESCNACHSEFAAFSPYRSFRIHSRYSANQVNLSGGGRPPYRSRYGCLGLSDIELEKTCGKEQLKHDLRILSSSYRRMGLIS